MKIEIIRPVPIDPKHGIEVGAVHDVIGLDAVGAWIEGKAGEPVAIRIEVRGQEARIIGPRNPEEEHMLADPGLLRAIRERVRT